MIMKSAGELLEQKIRELKEQKKAVILAHNYQIPAIQDIADCLGDSLELSKISKQRPERLIVFCGVRFMAETAKILSPHKKVILPVREAGCPMADMISPDDIVALKKQHPDAWVVSYVNTSAEVKALSDVCCTSANAVSVVKNVPVKKIIFTPDRNLGWWVQKNVPEKEIVIWQGFCVTHEYFNVEDLRRVRSEYPDAEIMVHPECRREVLEEADVVLSTAGMLKAARASKARRIVVGTEEGLLYRLKKDNPEKEFFSLGAAKICVNMKRTRLEDLARALETEQEEIALDKDVIEKAARALERMLEYV